MRNKIDSLPMILGVLAVASFCSLIIVVSPAVIPQLDLSSDETGNIGSTIGGVVGPIVSMFSAYLLYDALTAQRQANSDQRIKADSDIIFMLLAQIDKEYDTFYLKQSVGEKDTSRSGYLALVEFCRIFVTNKSTQELNDLLKSVNLTNILYLISSFELVKERIQLAGFSMKTEEMFNRQLTNYYRAKFQFPLSMIVDSTEDIHHKSIDRVRIFHHENKTTS
jgi:hypothetical protein